MKEEEKKRQDRTTKCNETETIWKLDILDIILYENQINL